MSRFPGGGGSSIFSDGPGKSVAQRLIETPWLAYAFLVALIACLLFYILDHHNKIVGPLQITLGICAGVVFVFRNAQGHGWEYALIWTFGIIGCAAYTIDRLIRTDYSIH